MYKLSSKFCYHQDQDDVERLLSLKSPGRMGKLRHLSRKKLKQLARDLYTKMVNYVIKLANILGCPSQASQDLEPSPTSPLLSLFILQSFPVTTQTKQSNNLQDLLVNLHKETFRVIIIINNLEVDQKNPFVCLHTVSFIIINVYIMTGSYGVKN